MCQALRTKVPKMLELGRSCTLTEATDRKAITGGGEMPQARTGGLRNWAWGDPAKLPEAATLGLHLKKRHEVLQAGRGWGWHSCPPGQAGYSGLQPLVSGENHPLLLNLFNPETHQELGSHRFPYSQNSSGDTRLVLLDGQPVPPSGQLKDGSMREGGRRPRGDQVLDAGRAPDSCLYNPRLHVRISRHMARLGMCVTT